VERGNGSWWDVAQDSTGYIVLEINSCGYCGGFHKYIAGWFSETSKITYRIWGYPHRKAPYLDGATDHNCELMFLSARSSIDGSSKDALWQSAPWSMTEKPLTSMKEDAVQMYIDIFINDYHDCLKFHLWSFFL